MPKSAPLRTEDLVPLATLTSSSATPTSRTRTPSTSWPAPSDAFGRDTASSSNGPSSNMESTHTRRRSSSGLVGLGISAGKNNRRHGRTKSENILEANEEESSLLSDPEPLSDKDADDFDAWDDDGIEDDEETGLTGTERKARAEKKRRNTRLSDRVGGDLSLANEGDQAGDGGFMRDSLINIVLICMWYVFSISISVYNKWMFGKDGKTKTLNLPFPLFITSFHMVVQFALASLVLFFFPRFRPKSSPSRSSSPTSSQPEPADQDRPIMTRWFYLTRIGPCGAATGLDIGFGNMSLKFISLTFYTMCKSSVLGFVLLFAFLFKLEKPSWRLGGIITFMTIGVVMMVAGETAFSVIGFILIMSSSVAAGFRWSLTQILLLRNPATSNPFSSLFFLTPVMCVSMLIIALPVEGPIALFQALNKLAEQKGIVVGFLILLFPGCLAFLMTSAEFALLKRTSVVTLSICGIFKEVVTISAASIVFEDELTPVNLSGLVVTIASIAAYNYLKITKMRDEARQKAQASDPNYAPVASAETDEFDLDSPRRSEIFDISAGPTPNLGGEQNGNGSPKNSPTKRPEDLE